MPQQVESPVGASLPDGLARTSPSREIQPLRHRTVRVRKPDKDESDRLLLRPPIGTSDAGNREPVVRAGVLADALGHGTGYLLADGPVLDEEVVWHPEQALLGLVGVGDDAFL